MDDCTAKVILTFHNLRGSNPQNVPAIRKVVHLVGYIDVASPGSP